MATVQGLEELAAQRRAALASDNRAACANPSKPLSRADLLNVQQESALADLVDGLSRLDTRLVAASNLAHAAGLDLPNLRLIRNLIGADVDRLRQQYQRAWHARAVGPENLQ
ncbi:hypothetical protein [Chitiniphilus eburneus]|uniref:hypothetical protein n=1 Tax=Chitiniphilus eburneus TaxID=2571148 RepID=UPI0035D046E7